MSSVRLSKATKELNISLDRAVEELAKHGHEIPNNRNHKITNDQYEVLMTAFADDLARKKRSEEVSQQGLRTRLRPLLKKQPLRQHPLKRPPSLRHQRRLLPKSQRRLQKRFLQQRQLLKRHQKLRQLRKSKLKHRKKALLMLEVLR